MSLDTLDTEAEANLDFTVSPDISALLEIVAAAFILFVTFDEMELTVAADADTVLVFFDEEEAVDKDKILPTANLLLFVEPVSFETLKNKEDADFDLNAWLDANTAMPAVVAALRRLIAVAEAVLRTEADADAVTAFLGEAEVVDVTTTATTPRLAFETELVSVDTTEHDAEIFVGCAID